MPIVKGTLADAEAYLKDHDWSKFDTMTDEDIARQVAENPDAAPLLAEGEDFSGWKRVRGRPRADARAALAPGYKKIAAAGGAIDIAGLRGRLGMTQAEFAEAFGFSAATVRSIEQGIRKPSGPAMTVLRMIERDPEFVRRTLAGAV